MLGLRPGCNLYLRRLPSYPREQSPNLLSFVSAASWLKKIRELHPQKLTGGRKASLLQIEGKASQFPAPGESQSHC